MLNGLPRVKVATILRGRTVRLEFRDGAVPAVDLTQFLWRPAFDHLRNDDSAFAELRVDVELGTIVWPNGADIDLEVLHGDAQSAPRALL